MDNYFESIKTIRAKSLRDESGDFIVDTCGVTDRTDNQYETAIMIDCYNIKVFETYPTWEVAKEGHKKWVNKAKTMTVDEFREFKEVVEDYPVESKKDWNKLLRYL